MIGVRTLRSPSPYPTRRVVLLSSSGESASILARRVRTSSEAMRGYDIPREPGGGNARSNSSEARSRRSPQVKAGLALPSVAAIEKPVPTKSPSPPGRLASASWWSTSSREGTGEFCVIPRGGSRETEGGVCRHLRRSRGAGAGLPKSGQSWIVRPLSHPVIPCRHGYREHPRSAKPGWEGGGASPGWRVPYGDPGRHSGCRAAACAASWPRSGDPPPTMASGTADRS